MSTKPTQILYRTQVTATSGRDGGVKSHDGILDLGLAMPKELGGNGAAKTNPEQLFAAGYSACFLSALKFVAMQAKQQIPADATVTADIGIGPSPVGFGLHAALTISLPGVAADVAQALVEKAHQVCPYSNATRGNIDVQLSLV
ncbi:MAG TPA: organic hydroperoxide resistance protein [Rheinheimera sp.]|nr:organic hydroperoxide resistance protein [Rheinheimera sp.]